MEKIINEFLDKLGEPSTIDALIEYVSFCILYDGDAGDKMESHHIFPRSKFPEYTNEKSFLVNLKYMNHAIAHLLLAEAYPIQCFTRTLNFMPLDEGFNDRRSEAVSKASKESWRLLKLDAERYDEFRSKRSLHMFEAMKSGSELNLRISESLRKFNSSEIGKEVNIKRGLKIKEAWANLTDVEYATRINNMSWKDADNYEERAASASIRYKNEEFVKEFTEKMALVNKEPEKRIKAGKTIKTLWDDPDSNYRELQKQSRKAGNDKLKESGLKRSNSAKIKEKWNDPIWKAKIMADRQRRKESKLNETN